jgi:hypothetical protein
MPGYRKLPPRQELEKWLDEGLTHAQIVERIKDEYDQDVSLSTVSSGLSRMGLTDRIRYDDFIPWGRISVDHNTAYQLQMLRIGARISKNLSVDDKTRARFQRWKEELDEKNLCVHYDYGSVEGFHYVARREGDGLVRLPDPSS